MKISCSHCKKEFTVSEDQIYDYNIEIILSCPECNKDMEIDLNTLQLAVSTYDQNHLYGENLKKAILKSVKRIPPMPQVAIKARKIISNPDSNFSELAEMIESDQGIASQVLRIANSAYYGVTKKVSSVQRASAILGTKTILEILTIACSSTLLGNKLNGYGLSTGDLWMHSLLTAYGSNIIAKKSRPELAEDAFTAGLIHDSGKLILDPYILERNKTFTKRLNGEDISFLDAEKDVLGFDHAEIASEVCLKWQIPDNISKAIRYHHYPAQSPEKDLTYIVHLADAISMMSGMGLGYDGMHYQADERALELLGILATDINIIMCEVVESVKNVVDIY